MQEVDQIEIVAGDSIDVVIGPVAIGDSLREGRFVEIGSPLELYATPHSAFTARLIGGANIVVGTASLVAMILLARLARTVR